MKIQNIGYRVNCDMPNCRNVALIKIEKAGFFKSAGIYLCKECMEELYAELGSRIVPKSIDNMLNKKIISKRTKTNERELQQND